MPCPPSARSSSCCRTVFVLAAYRCTDGTIYSVVEGGGTAKIGNESFEYEPRDTFVVPSWMPLELEAHGETVLFSFSDRPGRRRWGSERERRG